jgi:hypothetical protein
MNYWALRKFYLRVKSKYPYVVDELMPEPVACDISNLPEILDSFIEISGFSLHDIRGNKHDARLVFVAVAVKIFDPAYFKYNDDSHSPYRMLQTMYRTIGCSRGQILYNLQKVKSYYSIYPEMRRKVDEIYAKLMAEHEK